MRAPVNFPDRCQGAVFAAIEENGTEPTQEFTLRGTISSLFYMDFYMVYPSGQGRAVPFVEVEGSVERHRCVGNEVAGALPPRED